MFTQNWATHIDKSIKVCYGSSVAATSRTCVEIGSFEGRGTLIMHELLCQHPDSKLFCIDPWEDFYTKDVPEFKNLDNLFKGQFHRFTANTQNLSKITPLKGFSDAMIPMLPNDVEFVYIDGDHSPEQVYKDAVAMFPHMKVGGFMVFDDYEWVHNGVRCRDGVDKFLVEYRDKLEIIFKGYQVIVKVLST